MLPIIRSAVNSLPSEGFIQFIKEHNCSVIGVDVTATGLGKLLCDHYHKIPFASEGYSVIEAYKKIIDQHGAKWIISGPENEIILLAEYVDEFREINCKLFHSPLETLLATTDKWSLYQKTKDILPVPFCLELKDLEKQESLLYNFDEELVIKPKVGRGSNGVSKVRKEKLFSFIKSNNISNEFILQKSLKGKEFSVDMLHDMDGKLLNAVIRERLKTDSGISIISGTVKIDQIFEHIRKLSEVFEFRGVSCIQFIEHEGKYYLTDVNPRFGGGAILSVRSSGSFSSNLINLLNDRTDNLQYNSFDYKEMTMYRSYKEYFV